MLWPFCLQAVEGLCQQVANGAAVVAVVAGAKGMGKSSFGRLLLNRLLGEVRPGCHQPCDGVASGTLKRRIMMQAMEQQPMR